MQSVSSDEVVFGSGLVVGPKHNKLVTGASLTWARC